ncbi:endonuclease III [Helicobacter monodelphidis]|uniref:endonuclease III n=1 Tax=Helicobacter sp. 15-1451 TaxID=2004995 RepID=UPI000DCE295E|nr:endonuclease III [Helicobacter sp. 15-1451]RAX58907.1 endonuclease III [Helicobacter sp. 15-1451]
MQDKINLCQIPKKATAKEAKEIKKLMLEHYAHAKTELKFRNLYELLIAVMLSAQCTDKRVNIVTPMLFECFPTLESLANANLDDVKALISSCSFFNNKAKNMVAMAQEVMTRFDGEIPLERDSLMSLSGVGQKTANVVLIEFCEANYIAVDTHVFRTTHRLGLSAATTPIKTEEELTRLFKDHLSTLHQAFVLFGRYICKAQKPLCGECFLQKYCKSKSNFKA